MTKEELRLHIAAGTAEYDKPVYTYAESVDQRKRLQKRLETRKKPANLAQEEWEKYLEAVESGNYRPEYKPETRLYDYEGL